MAGSFTFVSTPGKKISLEHQSHPCPKCKHHASVQLIRSERQWIIFNKCISSIMRVRYECSQCKWKNEELPFDMDDDMKLTENRLIPYMPSYNSRTSRTLSNPVY